MHKVIILIIVSFLLGCSDIKDAEYKDYATAKKAGAVQRGWIPPWLADSAYDIKETHDLDNNKSILYWKYTKEENWHVPATCKQIKPNDAPVPEIKRSWWPSDVPASSYTTYRHVFYKCGEKEFLALLPAKGEALFWRN